ncbi:MAG: methylenetetrahydrofolate reductase [Deltaproteobacteria bacterium]|jgi:methylenetetrahydrofolate reductase (NADPH)|nr:methylenetetrahydrofolate reductase [Deltaproteobacteria bacterium]
MKVIDHIHKTLAKNSGPEFSYEIVPPPRGRSVKDIIDIVEGLSDVEPQWIDVTSHASSAYYLENNDGSIQKKTYRKRPGTLGICGIIQNRFRIDTVAHILCQGFTKEETEDALIELNFLGIHNVLALRGDSLNYSKEISKNRSVNQYAADLVEQINGLKQGKFIEDISNSTPLDYCIGVAGYPEKHFEAANFKTDILNLKKKVDAGADYLVTQMFFDNKSFYSFKAACLEAGIHVPIIPGLKIIRSAVQLKTIPKTFNVDLPEVLVDEILETPGSAEEIGLSWAQKQVEDLVNKGEKNIHFYIMNDTNLVLDLVHKIK